MGGEKCKSPCYGPRFFDDCGNYCKSKILQMNFEMWELLQIKDFADEL
ncbi:hypothetical protein LEP1GSC041_2628 [Leptospira noguchii str. 2006001870]|nr:hypothetical protein LEP1GSC041_2628 [Leptospira noguchii str. 2006001870]